MVLGSYDKKGIGLVTHTISKLNIVLAFVSTQAEILTSWSKCHRDT